MAESLGQLVRRRGTPALVMPTQDPDELVRLNTIEAPSTSKGRFILASCAVRILASLCGGSGLGLFDLLDGYSSSESSTSRTRRGRARTFPMASARRPRGVGPGLRRS